MKSINPQDLIFFLIEGRQQPTHVAALHIFTPPSGLGKEAGKDFVKKIYEAWRQELVALEPFNKRPIKKAGKWYWEEDEQFEIDYHLRHVALPAPGRIRELLALVSQLHAFLLDRNRPLWEIYLIEGLADGRFAMYSKIHHGLVDGVSGIKMLTGALSSSAKEIKPPVWVQDHRSKNSKAKAAGKSVAIPKKSAWNSLLGAVEIGAEILPGLRSGLSDVLKAKTDVGARTLPFQAPPSIFNVPISGSRRFVAQSYSIARMKRIGASVGATVNDVSLAVCASALRQYLLAQKALPKKSLVAMVPVSLHSEGSSGNQTGVLMAKLCTDVADPLKRLKLIVESTTAGKQRLNEMSGIEKIAHAAMSLMPMGADMLTGRAGTHPAFNLVISNVPGPKEPLYLHGARLAEAYPLSIPANYQALNITVSGNGDDLGFGFTACRRAVPNLQRMIDYLDVAFAELEAAIGAGTGNVDAAVKPAPRKTPPRTPRKISNSKLPKP